MNLTITNHPAVADHPFEKGKKLEKDGKPVPLFPDQRAIRLDGRIIAYVGPAPDFGINILIKKSLIPDVMLEEMKKLVVKEHGEAAKKVYFNSDEILDNAASAETGDDDPDLLDE